MANLAAEHGADDVEVIELMLAGWPDPRADIFPALTTRPCSASIRWSSLAFQMPRLAAARRRFHFIRLTFRPEGPRRVYCIRYFLSIVVRPLPGGVSGPAHLDDQRDDEGEGGHGGADGE